MESRRMKVELNAEATDKRLNNLVAITVVIFSVATGPGNIKDGNIVQPMAKAQANSLDRWNEFQATKTKLHIHVTKYKAESPKLADEAKGFSDQYEALNFHGDQFDAAEASLATAISIAAVAAHTER